MSKVDYSEYYTSKEGTVVPNVFPIYENKPYRIALIGEAPGKNEEVEGKPFVGAAGWYLDQLLLSADIDRKACYVGNICQVRPPHNDLTKFDWYGSEIQSGLAQLRNDLGSYQPKLIVLLGKTALRAAKGTYQDAKGKTKYYSIDDWRGSLFICDQTDSPFYGYKCMATYHPASLLPFRSYENLPLVRHDLKRAHRHGCFSELPSTQFLLDVQPELSTIISRLQLIRQHKITIGLDIEGGVVQGMSCLSISPTESEAFIIPFVCKDGTNYWTEDEEVLLWKELAETLQDPNVPKVLQNAMYDRFVLAYKYKLLVRNIADDTMLKHWELYCEMPKNLGLQVSLYTEEPFYKDERHTGNQRIFWEYCCKDSAVTNKINTVLSKALHGAQLGHYRFNVSLLDPFLYVELRGMKIDDLKRDQRVAQLRSQAHVDLKAKIWTGTEQLKLDEMVGYQLNVNSNQQMVKFLYEDLKLPLKLKERANGEKTPTADFETLLTFGIQYSDERLHQCIAVRRIRKHASDITGLTTDADGRIRTSINIVGAVTGRTSSSTAPTDEGGNLQTVREEDRDLFPADDGHEFCQLDLRGADGWTVAAHCARLKDSTMLEDYLYGLKPAKIIALMHLKGTEVNSWDRAKLKFESRDINADTDKTHNYLYYASKRVQHGTNYRMGPAKLAAQIFMDTEGMARISVEQAGALQRLYKLRYPGVELYQKEIAWTLQKLGYIVCASGHKRIFFGKKDDESTINDGCSEEPQHNTTYATNKALLRLWTDPDNHDSRGGLIIWPCHQIHDALCVQWPKERREWAVKKVFEYFNNPIVIGGVQVTIPFEGKVGPSWGESEMEL